MALRITTGATIAVIVAVPITGCIEGDRSSHGVADHAASGTLVLSHGSVVPMTGDPVLRDWTLVLANGHVVAMGPTGSVAIPEEAEVYDLSGSYVLPGLIDAHVHLREPAPSLALFPANGVTTVLNLEGHPSHLALRDSILDQDLFAPRILSSGPFIERIVDSPSAARQEVRRMHVAGYDLIKVHGDMEEETFAATVEEARSLNLLVIGHYPRNLSTGTVLDRGLDALAHAEELLKSPLLEEPTDLSPDSVQAIARIVAQSNTGLISTLAFFTGMRDQATDCFYQLISQAELAYVSPERRRGWLYDGHREYIPEAELPWYEAAIDNLHRITGAIQKQGGVIIAGTDTPLEFTIPGFSLHRELDHLVAAGLTPLEALRAATLAPAEMLREPELGRIEVGAAADLVILGEDPTLSLAALQQLEAVVLRGRWYPGTALRQKLDEVAAAYARAEVLSSARERLQRSVLDVIRDQGIEGALSEVHRMDTSQGAARLTERDFNTIGYRLLREGALDTAIEVFRLNVRLHPTSANVYDSLGEAYLVAGRLDEAERSYRQALDLDFTMDSARRGLQAIEERRRDPRD